MDLEIESVTSINTHSLLGKKKYTTRHYFSVFSSKLEHSRKGRSKKASYFLLDLLELLMPQSSSDRLRNSVVYSEMYRIELYYSLRMMEEL